jgi:hypothetical protein
MIFVRRRPATLVMRDSTDDDGTMWRAVTLGGDGTLTIAGHDVGPGVEQFFGCREYEFTRRFSKQETIAVCRLLGIDRKRDLLAGITERFASTTELEQRLASQGLAGEFWSRTGD